MITNYIPSWKPFMTTRGEGIWIVSTNESGEVVNVIEPASHEEVVHDNKVMADMMKWHKAIIAKWEKENAPKHRSDIEIAIVGWMMILCGVLCVVLFSRKKTK